MFSLLLLCTIALFFISIGYWIPAFAIIIPLLIIKTYQLLHINKYKENLAIKKAVEQKFKERELNSELVQTGLFSYDQVYHNDKLN